MFRKDFYSSKCALHFDLAGPGIYEWRIEGVGVYVGKAKKLKSRIRAYPNNVRRMIAGLPWHGNPVKEYRGIHSALRDAHDKSLIVTVSILENCREDQRAEREQYWIAKRLEEASAGGLPLLNA
jgi:hypothetical protein